MPDDVTVPADRRPAALVSFHRMRTVGLAAGEAFGVLVLVVDPFGNTPVFVSLTSHLTTGRQRREALATAVAVAAVLIVFMFAGEPLLHLFGISLESLQIAGGVVISIAGFQMVAGATPLARQPAADDTSTRSIALTPMAIPYLAGPGAMAAVMALDARDSGSLKYLGFAAGIIAVAFVVFVCMSAASWTAHSVGGAAIEAFSRVVGLFVLAIGVEMIIHGVVTHGALTHLHRV